MKSKVSGYAALSVTTIHVRTAQPTAVAEQNAELNVNVLASSMRTPFLGKSFQSGAPGRSTKLLILALLGTSVGLNLLLANRVRQLGSRMDRHSQLAQLQVGTVVPPITAKELDGRSTTIAYAGSNRSTILYIFSPQCVWCARNMDNFKALVKAKSEENRFIGLSLSQEGLADYVRTSKLTIPVLTGLSSETISIYKLGNTPQTLVISPSGHVVQNWKGAWINKQKSDVEVFFHVTLPGIQLTSSLPAGSLTR